MAVDFSFTTCPCWFSQLDPSYSHLGRRTYTEKMPPSGWIGGKSGGIVPLIVVDPGVPSSLWAVPSLGMWLGVV